MGIDQWRDEGEWLDPISCPAGSNFGKQAVADREAAVFLRRLTGIEQPAHTQPTGVTVLFRQL